MLLIDGVKYDEWTDLKETEDLEPMIQKHAKYIFGENVLYIDRKQKLRSLAGTGSIPDAYVISLGGDSPHWHIVEIELSYKDPGRHLVTQINDFINGMKNSRNVIVSAINQWIKTDNIRALEFKRRSQCEDIHEFLSDLIKKDHILTIIIEKNTERLKEAIQIFEERYKTEIVEFRTFRREEAEAVHAHLFEPLYELKHGPVTISKSTQSAEFLNNSFEIVLKPSCFTQQHIHVPIAKKSLFPKNGTVEIDAGSVVFEAKLYDYGKNGQWLQNNLDKWFNMEPKPKVGDRIRISVIEPMKKYRLEIIK